MIKVHIDNINDGFVQILSSQTISLLVFGREGGQEDSAGHNVMDI